MLLKKLKNYIVKWLSYQKTMDELSKLSERDLRDMGISHADIQKIAWNSSNIKLTPGY